MLNTQMLARTPIAAGGARSVRRASLLAFVVLAACGAGSLPSAIEQQLAANARRHGIAGQAVLILRDDKVLYRGSHGFADRAANRQVRPDDLFPVFSVSKLFSSILVMQLVERGEIDLKQPVGRYVADLPERWRAVTVDEVLNHVSGLPDYSEPGRNEFPATAQDVFASLADQPLLFAPGTQTRYTQTNFVVLGALLEAHYKAPYRQIVTERIVKPLALKSTYFGRRHLPTRKVVASYRGKDHELAPDLIIDWPEYAIVHAELYTTIDDLGTFLRAVRTGRLVKPEALLRLWKPTRLRDGGTGWFAAGWDYEARDGQHRVGHDGGAVLRATLVFRDSLSSGTFTYIYLTNGSATNVWSRTLIESLMEIVARYPDHT